jgi:hypothetical protein
VGCAYNSDTIFTRDFVYYSSALGYTCRLRGATRPVGGASTARVKEIENGGPFVSNSDRSPFTTLTDSKTNSYALNICAIKTQDQCLSFAFWSSGIY